MPNMSKYTPYYKELLQMYNFSVNQVNLFLSEVNLNLSSANLALLINPAMLTELPSLTDIKRNMVKM